MKKTLLIIFTILLALVMCLSALADSGSFIGSPSNNQAPVLISAKDSTGKIIGLIITSYSDRKTLPDDICDQMETAYDDIIGTDDITTLSESLAEYVAEHGILSSELAVSDLFDINYDDFEDHGSQEIDIVVSAETLDRFVALLQNYNGNWELVQNARVETIDGDTHLLFTVYNLTPLAIVVNVNEDVVPPKTGDSSGSTVLYIILMIAAAALLIFVVIKRRKTSQAEK